MAPIEVESGKNWKNQKPSVLAQDKCGKCGNPVCHLSHSGLGCSNAGAGVLGKNLRICYLS